MQIHYCLFKIELSHPLNYDREKAEGSQSRRRENTELRVSMGHLHGPAFEAHLRVERMLIAQPFSQSFKPVPSFNVEIWFDGVVSALLIVKVGTGQAVPQVASTVGATLHERADIRDL